MDHVPVVGPQPNFPHAMAEEKQRTGKDFYFILIHRLKIEGFRFYLNCTRNTNIVKLVYYAFYVATTH